MQVQPCLLYTSEAAAFERRALEEETQRAIDALSIAAEQAHKAAESACEAAKRKVEQLSEAAFAAGQKADAAFGDRLDPVSYTHL